MERIVVRFILVIFFVILLTAQAEAAYEVVMVTDGGTLMGKAKLNGTPPPNKKILITKNFDICGEGEREIPEVVAKNGALAEVIVYIDKIAKGKAWPKPQNGEFLLNQKGCRFIPYLQVVPRDGELIVQNSDPVLHNIHVREIMGKVRRTIFNFGQPKQGQRVPQKIKTIRNKEIKVECEAHNFMHGWMLAAENPYFDITKEDGSFKIEEIPPGNYTVITWHPILGIQKREVSVSPKGATEVFFEFTVK